MKFLIVSIVSVVLIAGAIANVAEQQPANGYLPASQQGSQRNGSHQQDQLESQPGTQESHQRDQQGSQKEPHGSQSQGPQDDMRQELGSGSQRPSESQEHVMDQQQMSPEGSASGEPAPGHTLNADGYRYKSPNF